MDESRKKGLVIGSAGAIFGSLLWIVIMGAVLNSAVIFTAPIFLGLLCAYLVIFLGRSYPEKPLMAFGVVAICVAIINIIFVNLLYKRIPDTIGGMSTGKQSISLTFINLFLALVCIVGVFMVLKDVLKTKK